MYFAFWKSPKIIQIDTNTCNDYWLPWEAKADCSSKIGWCIFLWCLTKLLWQHYDCLTQVFHSCSLQECFMKVSFRLKSCMAWSESQEPNSKRHFVSSVALSRTGQDCTCLLGATFVFSSYKFMAKSYTVRRELQRSQLHQETMHPLRQSSAVTLGRRLSQLTVPPSCLWVDSR